MRPSLLIPAIYAATAIVCCVILSSALGTGIEQIVRGLRDIPVSKASDSGRFVMQHEYNDGYAVLDTQTSRVCIVSFVEGNSRCTKAY